MQLQKYMSIWSRLKKAGIEDRGRNHSLSSLFTYNSGNSYFTFQELETLQYKLLAECKTNWRLINRAFNWYGDYLEAEESGETAEFFAKFLKASPQFSNIHNEAKQLIETV